MQHGFWGAPTLLSIEHLIEHYGLLAIFIGAGIEGEAVVFLGGVLAHRGLLPYWQVACAAAVGSFLLDQVLFFTGRYARGNVWVQKIISHPIFARVTDLLERYPTGFILAFRFIYGMRTISPIAIGMSRIPILKFVALNALAAAIWGPVISGIGFVFGRGIERILGKFPLAGHLSIAVAVVIALMLIAFLYQKHSRK
jgi:membrane protein DedA with SNARE-associated domain